MLSNARNPFARRGVVLPVLPVLLDSPRLNDDPTPECWEEYADGQRGRPMMVGEPLEVMGRVSLRGSV
jgi:hypothetical protein